MARKLTACRHERVIFTVKSRNRLVKEAVEILKTWTKDFDAIAVSGYSSALVVPIIAHKLKKNIVLVRKTSETRFSNHNVEGQHGQRVLFFDDLIDSGSTFRHIKKGVESISCRLVGTYLYNSFGCNSVDEDLISMNNYKSDGDIIR